MKHITIFQIKYFYLVLLFVIFLALPVAFVSAETASGLVGHWTLDEGTGAVAGDSSANGNNGTISGGAQWVSGKIGTALAFDGINDVVEINKNILPKGSPFTISMWAVLEDTNLQSVLISHNFAQVGGEIFIINYQSNWDRILYDESMKSGFDRIVHKPTGDWMHIVWTSDGAGNSVYYYDARENTKVGSQGGAGNSGNNRFLIGARPTDWFKGKIDDVRVYNRQLSSADVAELFEQGTGAPLAYPSTPTFGVSPGTYSAPIVMTIQAQPGKTVYYTLDGTNPTVNSTKYTGPIYLTSTTTVTARAFDGLFSNTATATYTIGGTPVSTTPDPGSVLPQVQPHHVVLRNWIKNLGASDFAVTSGPITWDDSYASTYEEVFHLYNLFGKFGQELAPAHGVRLPPERFLLSNIEADGKVNLTQRHVDPQSIAWWATWDYQGNPFRPGTANSTALLKRALVAGAVDLIMHEDYWSKNFPRSDYVGGHLIWLAISYHSGKHLLPPEVASAYEAGLRRLFFTLEQLNPSGPGGTDMETFQIVGMWYVADAIGDPALMERWKTRAHYVLSKIMRSGGATHTHGTGSDISYDGIWQYFITWATAASKDITLLLSLERVNDLKSHLTFPEPTGHVSGPSHWNTGTTMDAPNDQWRVQYRDVLTGMLTNNALYLPSVRSVTWLNSNGQIKTEDEMRAGMKTLANQATNRNLLTTPNTTVPTPWTTELHWINFTNYLRDFIDLNHYRTLLSLYESGSELLKAPVLRSANYVRSYADDFVTFKFPTFAGAIHTANVNNMWANNVSGLSGGALSEFWTPGAGSVIQGKNRGSQNGANADSWSGANGPLNWSVHAITGIGANGGPFSSARNLWPVKNVQVNGNISATVTVSGDLGPSYNDPNNGLLGTAGFNRIFFVDEKGVRITSSLTSAGTDTVQELWEMIPVFVRHKSQGSVSNSEAVISFKQNDQWVPATSTLMNDVKVVRIVRFGEPVYISFIAPQRVKISAEPWLIYNGYFLNLMVDLLDDGSTTLPTSTSVEYVISPIEVIPVVTPPPVLPPPPPPIIESPVIVETNPGSTRGGGGILNEPMIDDPVLNEPVIKPQPRIQVHIPAEIDDTKREEVIITTTPSVRPSCSLDRNLFIGIRGDDVRCLQNYLIETGHYVFADGATGFYGPITKRSVTSWQGSVALDSDGYFGPMSRKKFLEIVIGGIDADAVITRTSVVGTISRSHYIGIRHSEVLTLQKMLNTDPDTQVATDGPGAPGNETDYFGSLTQDAVRRFQKKHDIVSSGTPESTGYGLVGPRTRAKLLEIHKQQ